MRRRGTEDHEAAPPRRLRRGMYLLPSLFTVGNIFCGYVSIMRATMGEFELASLLVMVAALLDALDGRVARVTGTTSEFGVQLDSIADVVSFGVAPSVLAFSWSLSSFGRMGWAVSFLYVMCGALRLARFNIQSSHQDRRYFVGLPIPAAACIVATTIYAHPEPPEPINDPFIGGMLLLLVMLVSVLMVSRIRYRSFKDLDMGRRRSYKFLMLPAAALAAVALDPQVVLMLGGFIYLISGIIPRFGSHRFERARDATVEIASVVAHGHAGDHDAR